MTKYIINGGHILRGSINISGAKNAILPIMSAAVLNKGITRIMNCPDISDVRISAEILREIGCRVEFIKSSCANTIEIDASDICTTKIGIHNACRCRSSITFLGALLARCKKAEVAYPGGCTIGERPLDIHEAALKAMKINVERGEEYVKAEIDKDSDEEKHIFLRFPSVGATENAMLAAAGAGHTVNIYGAATEPEIVCLAEYLNILGAKVYGAGTNSIKIEGLQDYSISEINFKVIPDRIETATYLIIASAIGNNVKIHGCNPKHVAAVTDVLRKMGCKINEYDTMIELISGAAYGRLESPGYIIAETYPAYPTDAQSIILPLLAVSKGQTLVSDRIFPERFDAADELIKMGADISSTSHSSTLCGRIIKGRRKLKGTCVKSHDLRAGAAMITAGLMAHGKTTVIDNDYIKRGYDNITEKLRSLGADIYETAY